MKIYYIAEIVLPSKSAYTLHVLKMCEAFSKLNHEVELIIFYKDPLTSDSTIFEKYNISSKFKITNIYNKNLKSFNFLHRIELAVKAKKIIKNDSFIISRSIISSLYLGFKKIPNILEIHTNFQSLTNFLFNLRNFYIKKSLIKFVLIHNNLIKTLKLENTSYEVLDDAVNLDEFERIKTNPERDCVYVGRLTKGMGFEMIKNIAQIMPNLKFDVYGNKNDLSKNSIKTLPKNLYLFDYVDYKDIPRIIKNHRIVLMPYEEKVLAFAKDLEIQNNMSPMKMFDYLASGRIILATDLKVYSHILKNDYNSFLLPSKDAKIWKNKIENINLDYENIKKNIEKNSLETVKKYSWLNRAKKIIQFKEI